MEHRTLNRTKLTVSRACLGTMTFGSQVDRDVADSMVRCCLNHGVNFIDTANVYSQGRSEEIVGDVLQGWRHEVILASKVGIPTGSAPEEQGLSSKAIMHGVETSLRRLRTDYLDIFYLHQPDPKTPLEESLTAFDSLVRQGKVRYIGASNFASWQVGSMFCLAARNGTAAPALAQPVYNLLSRRIEQEFLPMCREFGLATVVYNPLAGGLLTAKHNNGAPLPGTRFDGNPAYLDRYWNQVNLAAVSTLSSAAVAAERQLVSVALNWLLHHTGVDCVILGASTLNQLEQNLAALDDGPLPVEVLAATDQAWQMIRGVSPQYNR